MNSDPSKCDVSFPKDAFIQEEFDVDRFLQEHCSKSGLNKLHKELGMYIKYLQLMMIDIMNAESSAIVNLSSDLKILQSKFMNIQTPLGQLKEEVSQIYKNIDENLNSISEKVQEKDEITAVKTKNINKLRVLLSSQRICRILSSHDDDSISLEILERSVDQYILQQMYCQNFDCVEFESQIKYSTNLLKRFVCDAFLNALHAKHTTHIVRCLQMYVLINTQQVAEHLYATQLVRPALEQIVNEESLKACDGNLSRVYSKILHFVQTEVMPFLGIVQKYHGTSGFNFLLNGVWAEIHEQLKLNLSSIYAPGIPDVFQRRFLETCEFLDQFQACFLTDRERNLFRQHASYVAHKSQWNLQVYYQLRHLEIVQGLEECFVDSISSDLFLGSRSEWKLKASQAVWLAMQRCFYPEVYLAQLLDRFWKQNLQIISRYCTWIHSIIHKQIPTKLVTSVKGTDTSDNDNSLQINLKQQFLVYLYLDVVQLKAKLESPFSSAGLHYLSVVPENLRELFVRSLSVPQKQFTDILTQIEDELVKIIYKESVVHTKHISQIPRLFRKTNRSVPTGPSTYLSAMVTPLQDFANNYGKYVNDVILKRILGAVHLKIIAEYKALVSNVLTSVTKTEESLRRLKKVRNSSQDLTAVSDDQKIRMQVQLDLTHYSKEAMQFVSSENINDLLALIKDAEQSDVK